jgi:hypothetical protein
LEAADLNTISPVHWTPFCLSSGNLSGVYFLAALRDEREDFSGEVTLQGSYGVTQTLQFIYDLRPAIAQLHASLKPGGVRCWRSARHKPVNRSGFAGGHFV